MIKISPSFYDTPRIWFANLTTNGTLLYCFFSVWKHWSATVSCNYLPWKKTSLTAKWFIDTYLLISFGNWQILITSPNQRIESAIYFQHHNSFAVSYLMKIIKIQKIGTLNDSMMKGDDSKKMMRHAEKARNDRQIGGTKS